MKKLNMLYFGLMVLLVSGCIHNFMPTVRPDAATVGFHVVVAEQARTMIADVYENPTVQTGTLIAVSSSSSVEQVLEFHENQCNVSFELTEGVWDISLIAFSDDLGVTYSGVLEGVNVVLGAAETYTVELGLATGDLYLDVDLTEFELSYHSPRITLLSPYDSIADKSMPISMLDDDRGSVVFTDVPVGPWQVILSAEVPDGAMVQIMSENSISPQGAESIAVDVKVPPYSDYGFLDITIRSWSNFPPKRPINVTAEQIENNQVLIEWEEHEDQVAETMRYAVYRQIGPAGDANYYQVLLADSITDRTFIEYIDFGISHGLTYIYWVQTYYISDSIYYTSALSDPVEIKLDQVDDPDPGPAPIDPDDDVHVVDGSTVKVANPTQLQSALNNDDVGRIILTNNISTDMLIDRSIVIDFKDKTLTGNVVIIDNVGKVRLLGSDVPPPYYHIRGVFIEGEGNNLDIKVRIGAPYNPR